MARGRMVSTTVATDVSLNGLSMEAEYLFLKTIPHLDRDGLILSDAPLLWGRVCPRRPQLLAKIDELISEWISAGLVIAYETCDGRALFFPGFRKNQNFQYSREGKSTVAPPPGFVRTDSGIVPQELPTDDAHTLDELPTDSRVSPDELTVKLMEEKLREEEEKGDNHEADWWGAWLASFPGQMVNPNDKRNLQPSVVQYGADAVVRAIQHANTHKRTATITIRYVESILEGWQQDGKLDGRRNGKDKPAGPERVQLPDGTIMERVNGVMVKVNA